MADPLEPSQAIKNFQAAAGVLTGGLQVFKNFFENGIDLGDLGTVLTSVGAAIATFATKTPVISQGQKLIGLGSAVAFEDAYKKYADAYVKYRHGIDPATNGPAAISAALDAMSAACSFLSMAALSTGILAEMVPPLDLAALGFAGLKAAFDSRQTLAQAGNKVIAGLGSLLTLNNQAAANGVYSNATTSVVNVGSKDTVALTAGSSTPVNQPQTVTVGMSQGDPSGFALEVGGKLMPLGSGPVSLTIPANQVGAPFTLVCTTAIMSAVAVQLTETMTNSDGTSATSVVTLSFAPNATDLAGASADRTIVGDLTPVTNNGQQSYDDLGNVIVTNVPDPGRDDVLNGSSGNDLIETGDGNNTVHAWQGGNDTIIGGAGNDQIEAGNGNNQIEGRGGQDILLAYDGDNEVYAGSKVDIGDALTAGVNGQASGQKGSLIGVGNGDNTVVGGSGNDLIFAGGGNNLIILGPGNDTFVGGDTVVSASADWSTITSGTTITINQVDYAPANTFTVPDGWIAGNYSVDQRGDVAGTSNDTIFGGSGASVIFTSNGDTYVDVGPGNSTVYAGAGDDTIFGGDGNGVLRGGGGDDYIDAEDGSHYVVGGQGDNTIFGGAGNDTLVAGDDGANWATAETGNNYVEGGSGDSYIFGSGGNDTLIAGDGNSTVYGGAGNEYIEGGSGNSELHSGSTAAGTGSDTIVADDGNTTIYGGGGSDTIYGGDGTDVIYGGDGNELIFSGDGGTADHATQITVGSGNTEVDGGEGYLQVLGGSGNDTLIAGDGDATLQGGSGTEQLYGGAGNSVLLAGSGADTLFSGEGSTTMQGGSGQVTYEIDADAGDVLIQGVGPNDKLVFGSGLSESELTVTGAFDAEGQAELVIELPDGGTVTVSGGLSGALNQFGFADNGNTYSRTALLQAIDSPSTDVVGPDGGHLVIGTSSGITLQSSGTGNDTLIGFGGNTTLVGGTGNETFVVNDASDVVQAQGAAQNAIQTSVSYTAAANVQSMTATGADSLTLTAAAGFDQTITANSGNDTLVGAAGNHTLVGGSGLDTFVLGQNTGHSTVIDTSSEGAVVQFAADTPLSSVSATKVGNDLVLTSGGGGATMQLQDYFSSPQSWTIEGSDGNTATALDLVGNASEHDALQVDALWSGFVAQTEAGLGFPQTEPPPSDAYKNFGAGATGYSETDQIVTTFSAATPNTPSFSLLSTQSSPTEYYATQLPINPRWTDVDYNLSIVQTSGADSEIWAGAGFGVTTTYEHVWLPMSWTPYWQGSVTAPSQSYSYATSFSPDDGQFAQGELWLVTETVTKTYTTTDMAGTPGAPLDEQPDLPLPNGLPVAIEAVHIQQSDAAEIQEIQLTPGDHTVYANGYTMVVGGDGNNTIYDAGLAVVNEGNNYIVDTGTVYGGTGNDTIIGAYTAIAGTGNDEIYTASGNATVKVLADTVGTVLVGGESDSSSAMAVLDAYYSSQGISDWQQRYEQGGTFVPTGGGGEVYNPVMTYVEPLPEILQVPGQSIQPSPYYAQAGVPTANLSANNFDALSSYSGMPTHTLVFGSGISPDQLNLSWGSSNSSITGTDDASLHTTLDMSWGTSGQVQVLIPNSGDPIGSGISEFQFSDGTTMSLSDMIAQAPPPPTFDPQLQTGTFAVGGGTQVLNSTFTDFNFGAVTPDQVSVTRQGGDLLVSVKGTGDAVLLPGWFDDQPAYSKFRLDFGDGTSWNENALNAQGLTVDGSAGNQTIEGINGFASTLIAGPNDTLVGGSGQLNTYVYNAGAGVVHIQDSSLNGTVQFGSGVTIGQIKIESGSLIVSTGSNGDALYIDNVDPAYISTTTGVSTFRFADGSTLTLQQLLDQGLDEYTGDGDVSLAAVSSGNVRLHAGSGNDTLIAGTGNDTLIAGTGADTFEFGNGYGQAVIDESAKAGTSTGTDTILFDGYQYPGEVQIGHTVDGAVIVDGASTIAVSDMNAIGRIQYGDGGDYDVYQAESDSATITHYDWSGAEVGVSLQTFDDAGNTVTVNEDANGNVLGHTEQSIDAAGDTFTTSFDADGSKVSDVWTRADGTVGDDEFRSDGSSTGDTYNADGSISSYVNDGAGTTRVTTWDSNHNVLGVSSTYDDGAGDITVTQFDANGNKLSDNWTKADGSYGTDEFNLSDGSITGVAYSSSGAFSTYVSDGGPDVTTTYFDALGTKLGDSWTRWDGTYGDDTFGLNGAESSDVYNPDGSHTNSTDNGQGYVVNTDYDSQGNKTDDSWTRNDGSYGNDVFNADGSYSGTANDGQGDVTTTAYDSAGTKTGDAWSRSNGAYGNDSFNTDGSYTSYANDGQGDEVTSTFDSVGVKTGDTWSRTDGSYGSDTFSPDGSSTGAINNADGTYSTFVDDGQGTRTLTDFDYWGNELGTEIAVNDGAGDVTTTKFDLDGTKLSDTWVHSDGTSGSDVFQPDGSSTETVQYQDGTHAVLRKDADGNVLDDAQYDASGNETTDSGTTADGSHYVNTWAADGSVTGLTTHPDGSYQTWNSDAYGYTSIYADYAADGTKLDDSWSHSYNGSTGSDQFNADGSSVGVANYSDGSYSTDTNDGRGTIVTLDFDSSGNQRDSSTSVTTPAANGASESKVNTLFVDGSTYASDTVTQVDGSSQQVWTQVDATGVSHGWNDQAADGSGSDGANNADGSHYSETYQADGSGSGVSVSADGSYQAWMSDGVNYRSTDFAANGTKLDDYWVDYSDDWWGTDQFNADGSSTGSVYHSDGSYSTYTNDGAGTTVTVDFDSSGNQVDTSTSVLPASADGASETKAAYIYADGSTYSTDAVTLADGSYQQAWSKSDGSHGDTNWDAASGETSGDVAQAGAGYSYTFANTTRADGDSESKVAYMYADGGIYRTDTVTQADGSYQQAWSKSDGSHGVTNWDAASGETWGDVAQAGAGYSYTFDNSTLANGASEAKVAYTYADGSTYSTDTVTQADGSYQQAWSKGDGSHGDTNWDAASGETSGDVAQAGAGYSYAFDNTTLANGASEAKVAYTYADGSTYSTDTVTQADGSYQQAWSKGDGSHGDTSWDAASGETSGDVAQAGAGYSYTFDNSTLANGASEAKVEYTYADGSTYSTDTATQVDGSYQQDWSKSDGTSGSSNVIAGAVQGDSWQDAAGRQGVDIAGNQLLIGSAAADKLAAANGDALVIGGSGNDLVTTGAGNDIVAFNAGDGQDTVVAGSGSNNVLSLGGSFSYSDLAFERSGEDLVLDVGTNDSVTFRGWYAAPSNQNFVTLQVIADATGDYSPGSDDALRNSKIQTFDFKTLVSEFDAAQTTDPSSNPWSLTLGLLDAHLAGSDTSALGGDLAYDYGKNGTLSGMDVLQAQSTLSSNQLGSVAQTIQPLGAAGGIAKIA